MAYPGEGYKMSNYGVKKYTAEQVKEQWKKSVDREKKVHQQHITTKKEAEKMAFIESSDAINYFNNTAVHPESSIYDQTFHFTEGYNQRLQRADMEHTQGLKINSEEMSRKVPVLSSSEYGFHPPLEQLERKHVRVGAVKRDFYRPRGINVNPEQPS